MSVYICIPTHNCVMFYFCEYTRTQALPATGNDYMRTVQLLSPPRGQLADSVADGAARGRQIFSLNLISL